MSRRTKKVAYSEQALVEESPMTPYKYSEHDFMTRCMEHIDQTYVAGSTKGHYTGEIQSTEYIMSKATTFDFLTGNIDKYISRFGKKNGYDVDDLYKAVHYLMMMAHYAEKIQSRQAE